MSIENRIAKLQELAEGNSEQMVMRGMLVKQLEKEKKAALATGLTEADLNEAKLTELTQTLESSLAKYTPIFEAANI